MNAGVLVLIGGAQLLALVVRHLGRDEVLLAVLRHDSALFAGVRLAIQVEPLGQAHFLVRLGSIGVVQLTVEVVVVEHGAGDLGGAEVAEATRQLGLVARRGHVEGHRRRGALAGSARLHYLIVVVLGVGRGVARQHDHAVQRGVGRVAHGTAGHQGGSSLVSGTGSGVEGAVHDSLAGEVVPKQRVVGRGIGIHFAGRGNLARRRILAGHHAGGVGLALDVGHFRTRQLVADGAGHRVVIGGGRILLGHGDREVQGIVGRAAGNLDGVAGQVLGAFHGDVDGQVREFVVAVAVGGGVVGGSGGHHHRLRRRSRGRHGEHRGHERLEQLRNLGRLFLARLVAGIGDRRVVGQHPNAAIDGAGSLAFDAVRTGHEVPGLQRDGLAADATFGIGGAVHREGGVVGVEDAVVVRIVEQVAGDLRARDFHETRVVVRAARALGQVVGKRRRPLVDLHLAVLGRLVLAVAGELAGLGLSGTGAVDIGEVEGGHHAGGHAVVAVVLVLVGVVGVLRGNEVRGLGSHKDLRARFGVVHGVQIAGHIAAVSLAGRLVRHVQQHGELGRLAVVVDGHQLAGEVHQVGVVGIGRRPVGHLVVGGQEVAAAEPLVGQAHAVAIDDVDGLLCGSIALAHRDGAVVVVLA